MTALILGCDPGKKGALALVAPDGVLVDIADMPDATGSALGAHLADFLDDHAPHTIGCAWVEKVHAMPGNGSVSMFNFGANYGGICTLLGGLRIRVEVVSPNRWKKAMGVTADKRSSRDLAAARWPEHAARFARVRDDGRAEAALIAEYGRRCGA